MEQAESSAGGVLVGYFEDEGRAERALRDLQNAGFTSAHVGVAHRAVRRHTAAAEPGISPAKNSAEEMRERVRGWFHHGDERAADARERENAELDEPEYTHDDLSGSLAGMSIPEERARYFSRRLRSRGGAVVTVNAQDRANIAEFILRDNGADLGENTALAENEVEPVGERVVERSATVPVASTPVEAAPTEDVRQAAAAPDTAGALEGAQDVHNVQLLGEVLRVHKDRIERGDVAVRKEVVTETQTIQVPVQREELVIEQHPPAATAAGGPGQEIRIPLSRETASVDKDTVVRENVAVGKKPVRETRELSSDVRREELVVDDRTKRAVNE